LKVSPTYLKENSNVLKIRQIPMLLHCLASDILRFEEKNERKKKSETFVKKQWFCSSLAEDNFDLTEKKR